MSDPELIKMRCPECDGGVEYPSDGVGQRIACPHCQSEFTLKRPVSKRPFLFGGICFVLFLVAAVFGAIALRHQPTPAELQAMPIAKVKAKAESGYDKAQFELATRYFNGERGVETNRVEAANWYRKAAEQELAAAQSGLGKCYASGLGVTSNALEAINWYRKAAEHGDAKGQNGLGVCYETGAGVASNAVGALKWYRKAAEQGFPNSERNIGNCYATGFGVEFNAVEAFTWYRKAAEQGLAEAQLNLGDCYAHGSGVASNAVESFKWYRKAAEQGNDVAQNDLGDCYVNGVGVPPNAAEGVNWYRKAADQGDGAAQVHLGNCYAYGIGVASNSLEAVKWYVKAAEHAGLKGGGLKGQLEDLEGLLAEADLSMLLNAEARMTNSSLNLSAIEILTESAQRDNPFIQKILGGYYANGYCVPTNFVEAAKWYEKAAQQGNAEAQEKLGQLYRTGSGVEKSASTAAELFRMAAEQDNADAQFDLGLFYASGDGGIRDLDQSMKWFRKAADRPSGGNRTATLILAGYYAEGSALGLDATDRGDLISASAYQEGNLLRELAGRVGRLGVQADVSEAVRWNRKAAELGSSGAAFFLGVKYGKGEGVTKDKAESRRWYLKAADLGNATAQFNLGVMYRDGDGVDKDAKEAFQWFQLAAEQGMAAAQCELGSAYLKGLGVLQDTQNAARWYFKAAKQGDALSAAKLGLLYRDAADTPTNRIEAHKWLSLSAAQGYEEAKTLRDAIGLKMSAPELAEARKRAQAFSAGDIPAEMVGIQTVGVARPAARGQHTISPPPTVNTTPPMKEGVPLTIYNAIAADAAKEWPGDYEMQAYVIKNQIAAYKSLHPQ